MKTPKTNGFVERFNGTVLKESFRVAIRETFYGTVEALQADLDAWLVHYNTERPHLGYRNQGRRPIDTVNSFVSQEAQEDTYRPEAWTCAVATACSTASTVVSP